MALQYKTGTAHSPIPQTVSTDAVAQPDRKAPAQDVLAGLSTYDEAAQQVFGHVVTRNYLQDLSKCKVLPLVHNGKMSPMTWFKIDKIVKEKDVFFADKLSMLYIALHKTSRNVILILNKQGNGDIELYLGARDFTGFDRVSGEILKTGLEGFFPGVGFSEEGKFIPLTDVFDKPQVVSVSAIASLRDDKKEDFVQGLERLINATSPIPQFRAYFIADNVSTGEVNNMIAAFNNLHSSLAPAESLQMTYSDSESKGVSESISKNFSKSIGESITDTVTHTTGYSETDTSGTTTTDSKNIGQDILSSMWHGLFGGETGTSHSKSKTVSKAIGKNFSDSKAQSTGRNSSETMGQTAQEGSSSTTTTGLSKQFTYKNRTVKGYLDIIDKQINRLQSGTPFGLWSVSTYFVAGDSTSAQQLANIYRGIVVGEEIGVETCAVNSYSDPASVSRICEYLSDSLSPRFDYCAINVSAGSVVTSKELAIHLSLPQSSVPGIVVEN